MKRHVKCDEIWPSCANYNVRQLRCSFISTLPTTLSKSVPARVSPLDDTSRSSGSKTCSPPHDNTDGLLAPSFHDEFTSRTRSPALGNETYGIHHLELLHNFRAGVLDAKILDVTAVNGFMAILV